MQPVETAPGLALVSDKIADPLELVAIWTVPAVNAFDGLVATALRFDHVAAPASNAQAAITITVAASLLAIVPPPRMSSSLSLAWSTVAQLVEDQSYSTVVEAPW